MKSKITKNRNSEIEKKKWNFKEIEREKKTKKMNLFSLL